MIFDSKDILKILEGIDEKYSEPKEGLNPDKSQQLDLETVLNYIGNKVDLEITPTLIEQVKNDTYEGIIGRHKYTLSLFNLKEKWNIPVYGGLLSLFLLNIHADGIRDGTISTIYFAGLFYLTRYFLRTTLYPVHYDSSRRKVLISGHGTFDNINSIDDKLHEYTHYLQDTHTEIISKRADESQEGLAKAIELDGLSDFGYNKKAVALANKLLSTAYARYALEEEISEHDILDTLDSLRDGFNPKRVLNEAKKCNRRRMPKKIPYSQGYTKIKLLERELGEETYPRIFRDISTYNQIKHISEVNSLS